MEKIYRSRVKKIYIIGVSEGGEKDTDQGFPKAVKGDQVRDITRPMNSSEKYVKMTTSAHITVPQLTETEKNLKNNQRKQTLLQENIKTEELDVKRVTL